MADMKELFIAVILTVVGVVIGLWVYHTQIHIGVIRDKIAKGELTTGGLPDGALETEEVPPA